MTLTVVSLIQMGSIPVVEGQQGEEEGHREHFRRLSTSGCAMLDKLLTDICNTLVVASVEQVC